MDKWAKIPEDSIIKQTVKALQENGITAEVVDSGEDAKKRLLELIPEGAEVMNTSSVTLDSIGLSKYINESGRYDSVKNKLNKLNRKTDSLKMQKLGVAPEYMVGSVHAVTQDGKVIVASNTGSQLPAYSYGSPHVIWIVGAQKIVKDFDAGFKRIYDYVLGKESERMMKLYGIKSNVSKLLIINKEISQGRLTMIIVKEVLGF